MDEQATLPVPKSRPRPLRVNVRYSVDEYHHLIEQARIANLRPATFLRGLSLGSRLRAVPRFPEEVYRSIRSLGGNLNQLAKQANMGRVDTRAVEALERAVNDLLRVLLR